MLILARGPELTPKSNKQSAELPGILTLCTPPGVAAAPLRRNEHKYESLPSPGYSERALGVS